MIKVLKGKGKRNRKKEIQIEKNIVIEQIDRQQEREGEENIFPPEDNLE